MVARTSLTLTARSLDPLAAELLRSGTPLRVHSVFGRALNLASGTGDLLGLVGPDAGGAPATIVLNRLPDNGFDRLGLSTDAAVQARWQWLLIGSNLRIDLRSAVLWRPTLAQRAVPRGEVLRRVVVAEATTAAAPGGVAPLLPHVGRLASSSDVTVPADFDPLCRATWAALVALVPSWRQFDPSAVEAALPRLVGLGPGSTPSGDDLIAGLLVATRRMRGPRSNGLGEACLAVARGRTTDLSVARISHAVRGAIEEAQELVLAHLLAGTGKDLEASVQRAARCGHTSGGDTLVGLLLGVRLALRQ